MSEEWEAEEQLFLTHGPGREQSSSGRRFFMRGGVKYALLELLADEPMHGYEMMKRLEEQSGGTYKPSAGSIYPTLQMLRDQGFVSSSKHSDGKKIFSITEEGRTFLDEERAESYREPEEPRGGRGVYREEGEHHREGGRNRRLTPAGKELLHLLKAAEKAAMRDAAKAAKLRSLLTGLKDNLKEMAEEMQQDE